MITINLMENIALNISISYLQNSLRANNDLIPEDYADKNSRKCIDTWTKYILFMIRVG